MSKNSNLRVAAGVIAATMLTGVVACGGSEERAVKEETAAQIENAIKAGREDARRIVTREFRDSMEFHGALLEANARKSTYYLDTLPQCEAAYDSAFISTIRTVRPDLADMLK